MLSACLSAKLSYNAHVNFSLRIFFIWWLTLLGLSAHLVEQIYVDFTHDGKSWRAEVLYDVGYATEAQRLDVDAPQPTREWLAEQSPEKWAELREGAEKYLRECIEWQVHQGDKVTKLDWTASYPDFDFDPPNFPELLGGYAYFRILVDGELPTGTLVMKINEGKHPKYLVAMHDIHGEIEAYEYIKPGGSLELMRVVSKPATAAKGEDGQPAEETEVVESIVPSKTSSFVSFVILGFEHVLPEGLDHVLFILAMVLLSLTWRPLLTQSLMFTLAHSVTLALSVLGFINLPGSIIEPLIALSIAFVAVENFWLKKLSKFRLGVIFTFGLIHGAGFAGALGEKLGSGGNIIMPLLAANIGVELAQVFIIFAVLLAIGWFRKFDWFHYLRDGLSASIALIGLYWFIDRI
ncbi:HupE/UreJ family protein [Persicirhabdus sediminis]|uniref:HupE/UreJ family protein n=1 Tax=Persicirhabdus sediminis TaxID=454144 RepID=A0A8J7MD43_9BACT|nr:HupE/UreJ family protein [Persicirhabdus sediminis]MBK1790333.1 HupE/UreJ family protein [Persicirhabdus sediminis]